MKKLLLTLLMAMTPLIVYAGTYEITTPGNNVGIGSTNPGTALDVQGTVRWFNGSSAISIDSDQIFNVKNYGALGNGITFGDGAITSSSNSFTSSSASFQPSDVGKVITIVGAGTSGVDLTTTIATYSNANTVLLTNTASTSVTNAVYTYGTDDTVAIQAAINAVHTAGTGTIFFPAGIFIVNGAYTNTSANNSQLNLPTPNSKAINYTFKGTQFQMQSQTYLPTTNASIIYFTRVGTNGTQSGLSTYLAGGFTGASVKLQDLDFRTVSNPANSAILLNYADQLLVNEVTIETAGLAETAIAVPTTTTSYALTTPNNGNHAFTQIERLIVQGFYTGVQLGEHGTLEHSGIYFCHTVIESPMSAHKKHIGFLNSEDDIYGISFTGQSVVDVSDWDIEHSTSGSFQTTYDINDPSNYGSGYINWNVVKAGVGQDNTFTVNGGLNIITQQSTATRTPNMYFNSGNIGIGTFNPSGVSGISYLVSAYNNGFAGINVRSINSSDGAYFETDNNSNRYVLFGTNGSVNPYPAYFGVARANNSIMYSSAGALSIGTQDTSPLTLGTNNNGYITINGSGNIGIGSTNPGQLLDVQGTLGYFRMQDTSGAQWHCKPAVSTGIFTCTSG